MSQYIRCIYQDSKGNYWFGPAGQTVARYDVNTLKYFSTEEFFNGNPHARQEYNSIHAITEVASGDIWFGTEHGLVRHDGYKFRSYTIEHGLDDLYIGRKCILADKKGTLWVGTKSGVYQYLPAADTTGGRCFEKFDLIPSLFVKDIMEDKSGNIWFATADSGVYRYNGKTISNFKNIEGLGDNVAGGMLHDSSGNYWFTMKGGICKYDGEHFTKYTTADGIGGSEVWGICMERSDIIWITSRGSTTRFNTSLPKNDPGAFRVFTENDGINCCVQSMHLDRSGNMWWGAGAGLYRFDGQNFYQVKRHGPW